MFTWVIPDLLAKAGYNDSIPTSVEEVVVAAEYPNGMFKITDDPVFTNEQVEQFTGAVSYVLDKIEQGVPVVVKCQQGRSRSVAVACTVAALYRSVPYERVHGELRSVDDTVWERSNIHILPLRLFPELFTEER